MTKVENSSILKPSELDAAQCPVCGGNIDWGEDEENEGELRALHCDRSFTAVADIFKISVVKLTAENIDRELSANIKSEISDEEEEKIDELK